METKIFIKEKLNEELNPHKRMGMVKGVLNKCANHLYDAYRELELAIQYCDDPQVREKLEAVRKLLGKDDQIGRHMDGNIPSVITDLQDISGDLKP